MNYWLTTHWPALEGQEDSAETGIYLPDEREEAGEDIRPGDMVLIYESRTGRTVVREDVHGNKHYIKSVPGREGIVSIAEVQTPLLRDNDSEVTRYADSTEIWWRWYAVANPVSSNGYVPRVEVNRVLGYKNNYPMRALGERHSGLKKLTKEQYYKLVELFSGAARNAEKVKRKLRAFSAGSGGGEESIEHKLLKEYVYEEPSVALNEVGLRPVDKEYKFPTQDRADVVLLDAYGKIIGLEVEVSVEQNQFAGVIQAVKYRHMLAVMLGYAFKHSRSFLVAYRIAPEIRALCDQYDVECFTVTTSDVEKWAKANGKWT